MIAELASNLRCFERMALVAETDAIGLALLVLRWFNADALTVKPEQKALQRLVISEFRASYLLEPLLCLLPHRISLGFLMLLLFLNIVSNS